MTVPPKSSRETVAILMQNKKNFVATPNGLSWKQPYFLITNKKKVKEQLHQ